MEGQFQNILYLFILHFSQPRLANCAQNSCLSVILPSLLFKKQKQDWTFQSMRTTSVTKRIREGAQFNAYARPTG